MWFCFDIYIWWLKKNIYSIDLGKFGKIFIHILTNDIKHICQQKFKSNAQKEKKLYEFAHDFNSFIMQTASARPNIEFFISLCLPRYDQYDQLPMLCGRNFINQKLQSFLHQQRNITLVWNENFSRRDFDDDLYHLTKKSSRIERLLKNCHGGGRLLVFDGSLSLLICTSNLNEGLVQGG